MVSKSNIDHKNTHFEFPELTRIHGVPTAAYLITIQCQVRDNCSTVHTTLGGDHHSHLCMVCTPEVYANVPNSASYNQPAALQPLAVQPSATQFQIQKARVVHTKETHLFCKVLAVERTIIQQIIAAIGAKLLKTLRNPVTNKITHTIPMILMYLSNAYGYLTHTEIYI